MTQKKMDGPMSEQEFETFLATTLKRSSIAPQADRDAASRVLVRLGGALPRQKFALWRLPAVLLDWEFDLAWTRVAALATCAALGFFVGMVGLDRQVDTADAALAYVSRADLGGMFDAEPARGANQ
jgi:hypothetical protein